MRTAKTQDWADAHADLSHRWAHAHFVGFVMSRFNFVVIECALSQYDITLHP